MEAKTYRRLVSVTPAEATHSEVAMLSHCVDPEAHIAAQQLKRARETIHDEDPHLRAFVQQEVAHRLLEDAWVLEQAERIIRRLSKDSRLPPRTAWCHGSAALVRAAGDLLPGGTPVLQRAA
jgi:hypothetical protein